MYLHTVLKYHICLYRSEARLSNLLVSAYHTSSNIFYLLRIMRQWLERKFSSIRYIFEHLFCVIYDPWVYKGLKHEAFLLWRKSGTCEIILVQSCLWKGLKYRNDPKRWQDGERVRKTFTKFVQGIEGWVNPLFIESSLSSLFSLKIENPEVKKGESIKMNWN